MPPEPLVLKQVVAQIDDRTTVICLDAAGAIAPIDQPFETINGDFMRPPFHYGCRSNVMPWMPGMAAEQRAEANAELQTRPKKQRDKRNFKKVAVPPEQDERGQTREPDVPRIEPAEPRPDPDALQGQDAWSSIDDVYADDWRVAESTNWYVDGGYTYMNKVSRGQDDDMEAGLRETAKASNRDVDTMFDIARPTDRAMVVWRGLKDAGSYGGSGNMAGLRVHDDAFMSTSTDRGPASSFALIDAVDPVLIRIEIPAGTKAIRPAVVGHAEEYIDHEHEVLLPRGTALRILSDTIETLDGRQIRVWHAIVM